MIFYFNFDDDDDDAHVAVDCTMQKEAHKEEK